MYKTIHKLIPCSCVHTSINVHHPYNLRKFRDFVSVPFRTNMRMNSISIAGPKAWESLPSVVKLSESLQTFKTQLFIHLLSV